MMMKGWGGESGGGGVGRTPEQPARPRGSGAGLAGGGGFHRQSRTRRPLCWGKANSKTRGGNPPPRGVGFERSEPALWLRYYCRSSLVVCGYC